MFAAMLEVYRKGQQEDLELERIMNDLPPNPKWKQLSEGELMARLEKSSAQIERGEYITLEELKEKMKSW
jgi:hypothetical protein